MEHHAPHAVLSQREGFPLHSHPWQWLHLQQEATEKDMMQLSNGHKSVITLNVCEAPLSAAVEDPSD